MTEILRTNMTEPDTGNDAAAIAAETLLVQYSFDLGYELVEELVSKWLQDYPARWLRLAIIEALYQGRYKSISVEQILVCWHRRSKPIYHFNLEFERLICAKLQGENLPEEESKPTPKNVVGEGVAGTEEASAKVSDRTPEVYTKNPPIAPMISKSQPNLSEDTTQEAESETRSVNEEKYPAVLSSESEENEPKKKQTYQVKETEQKQLSEKHIKRQIIDDLLKDPWLDERDEAVIQSLLNSTANGANGETSAVDQEGRSANEKVDDNSDVGLRETPNRIHEFNPTVDSSEFYTRLQSVLQHKLNHPEEEPRKRWSKKPR